MHGRMKAIYTALGIIVAVAVFLSLIAVMIYMSSQVSRGIERKAEAVSKIGLVDLKLDIDSDFNVVLYLVPHTQGDYRLLLLYKNGTVVEKTYYGLSSVSSMVIDNIYTSYVPFKVYVISIDNGMIVGSLTDQQVYGVRYLPNVKFDGWVDKEDILRAMGLVNTERFNGFLQEVGSKAYTYSGLVNKVFLDYRAHDIQNITLEITYSTVTGVTTINLYINGSLAGTTSFAGVTGTGAITVPATELCRTLFGTIYLSNVTVSIQSYGSDYYISIVYGIEQQQIPSTLNYTFVYVIDKNYVLNIGYSGSITVYETYPLGVISGNEGVALQIAEGTANTTMGLIITCGINGDYDLSIEINRLLLSFFE